MQIEHKNNGNTFLMVEVPKDVNLKYTINRNYLVMDINLSGLQNKCLKINRGDVKGFFLLPPNNWQIFSEDASTLNEEEAKELIYSFNNPKPIFKDYIDDKYFYGNYIQSASTLFQSLGMDENKRYLILKAKK